LTTIGYARVSTVDQDLTIQIDALKAAGCDVIRQEKASGTSTEGRAELKTALDFLRKGDVLAVTRIDRLARSIGDLQDIVRAVKARGASFKATELPIDTSTATDKCFLEMLGVFAEFETNLRKERQLEGIARARAAGVYKGRPASIDAAKVREMKAQGLGASEIAKALKIAAPRSTDCSRSGRRMRAGRFPPRCHANTFVRVRSSSDSQLIIASQRNVAMGHVWTAPGWQELSSGVQHWSVQPFGLLARFT
jgi:DNA invertase Pin-like site-specific DNA recombinase